MQTDLTRIADELAAASSELVSASAKLERYADTINVRGIFTACHAKEAIEALMARCTALGMEDITDQLESAQLVAESIQQADEAAAAERLDEERREIEFSLHQRANGGMFNGDLLRSLY